MGRIRSYSRTFLICRLARVKGAREQGPLMHPPSHAMTSINWASGFLGMVFNKAWFFLSSPSKEAVLYLFPMALTTASRTPPAWANPLPNLVICWSSSFSLQSLT